MGRSEKDTAARKFTDMDAAALRASMGRFEGVCIVATVNPDGTPTPPSSRRRCPTTSTSS